MNLEIQITEEDFQVLRALAQKWTGVHISEHRKGLIFTRLARRVRALGLTDFASYRERLDSDRAEERLHFIHAVTTHVTEFFREQHHFDFLREQVAPEVRCRPFGQRRVRVWSAGCATGEEPYSIAMELNHALADLPGFELEILATDIDEASLHAARRGIYRVDRLKKLGIHIRGRCVSFGTGGNEGYFKMKSKIRNCVRFECEHISRPSAKLDMFDVVFCRNVLIYFDESTLSSVCDGLVRRLRPGGHLFLGHSESGRFLSSQMQAVGTTVYRRDVDEGGWAKAV